MPGDRLTWEFAHLEFAIHFTNREKGEITISFGTIENSSLRQRHIFSHTSKKI